MKNINNLQTLIFTVIILLTVSLGCKDIDKKDSTAAPTPATITNKPVQAVSETPPPKDTVSNLKWNDYDNVYNTKSNSTDMQKDALWKDFKGKTVNWQGTVEDVSEGMLGGLKLNIKMNADTLTHDITLELKKDQKDKAMSLTKGKKVSFTGKLDNYGGAILPLQMSEGEIK